MLNGGCIGSGLNTLTPGCWTWCSGWVSSSPSWPTQWASSPSLYPGSSRQRLLTKKINVERWVGGSYRLEYTDPRLLDLVQRMGEFLAKLANPVGILAVTVPWLFKAWTFNQKIVNENEKWKSKEKKHLIRDLITLACVYPEMEFFAVKFMLRFLGLNSSLLRLDFWLVFYPYFFLSWICYLINKKLKSFLVLRIFYWFLQPKKSMIFCKIHLKKGLWIAWSTRFQSFVKVMYNNSISGRRSALAF